jgi:hypothetical protein
MRKHVLTNSMRNSTRNDNNDPLIRKRGKGKNPIGEEYNVTTNPLNNEDED